MNHENWTERAGLWLDGELGPAESADFEAHLAGCPDCRALLEGDRQVAAALRQTLDAAYPADLEARVLAEARRSRRVAGRAWMREFRIPAPVAAAAAVVLVVAGALGGRLLYPAGAPQDEGSLTPASLADLDFAEMQDEAHTLLDRVRTILVALSTAQPDREGEFHLAAEQNASENLMRDVRMLASEADADGNDELLTLVRDLEAILLDVATWQGRADASQVAVLQGGIRDRSLIYRLNLYTETNGGN